MKWKQIVYYLFFCLCMVGVGFGWHYFKWMQTCSYEGIYTLYGNLLFVLLGVVFILPQVYYYFTNYLKMRINWILFILNLLVLLFGCINWALPVPEWIVSVSPVIIFAAIATLPHCWYETRNKTYYRPIWK